MADPVSWVAVGIAALSAAGSTYASNKAERKQRAAQKAALAQAEKTAENEEQARNKANQNEADISGLLDANSGSGGTTSLTGAMGEQVNRAQLGGGGALGGGSSSLGS